MSDARLRDLERQFRGTGSPHDEAAWLQARAQAGLLSDDQQRLLGYLGCSVPAHGVWVAPQPRTPHDLGGWVHGLPHFDGPRHFPWAVEIYWRIGAALVRVIPGGEVSAALEAARLMDQWIAEPTDARAVGLVGLQDEVGGQIPGQANLLPGAQRRRRLLGGLTLAMTPARWPTVPVNAMPSKAAELLAEELGVDLICSALRGEIVPWALGLRDPVRERIETRQGDAVRE